ncbi:dolichyl-diphosphooligosaccharide--protein glycosyltransferase subunit 1 [Agrilus planipennis]|uniref:Dolichyl-diphosphooligosaccharide--protein glycosyltransferase subunit 1 n=1 Tax=Agrilus planipennis TaxID=224129 RepID=A0A7F5RMY6_AGRPL|nr:dolichyl-diphosphooligosaccharide--protein glycosyltransferase subunit 1 [Agrilus planipennis]
MFNLLILCALFINAYSLETVNKQIVNKNIERSIDLSSQLVKISATLTVENTGKESASNILILLEPKTKSNVSYISVKNSLKEELKLTEVEVQDHKSKQFYKVELSQSLQGGRTIVLTLEIVLTKSLIPYPSSISQKDRQLVRYFGSHYFYSPYNTLKQKTTVNLGSRNIESYTKLKPVSQLESTIVYGQYANVQPFSIDPMVIHYENNSPFLTVTSLKRLIEISHWGSIAIEENIDILHSGAKLKGPFSRYDYQRDVGSSHHSVKSYKTVLPAAAHSIYYRDSNGNISTSQVRVRKDWIELELRPRFPLFGGWRTSYTLGYSVPSYQYLFKTDKNQYLLHMRLLDHIFDDMQVDLLETKIVLPVGVSNVQLTTPYEVERLPDSLTYKYLDKKGRLVISLRKTNLVEHHIQDFEVVYEWPSSLLFHEPISLTFALYVLFLVIIIYVRLDFSLHEAKSEHVKTQ